jgi:hypothetical protein
MSPKTVGPFGTVNKTANNIEMSEENNHHLIPDVKLILFIKMKMVYCQPNKINQGKLLESEANY